MIVAGRIWLLCELMPLTPIHSRLSRHFISDGKRVLAIDSGLVADAVFRLRHDRTIHMQYVASLDFVPRVRQSHILTCDILQTSTPRVRRYARSIPQVVTHLPYCLSRSAARRALQVTSATRPLRVLVVGPARRTCQDPALRPCSHHDCLRRHPRAATRMV